MRFKRSAGILLHITSLPGKRGTGTLGDEAYHFAEFLEKSSQHFWQILPFNPVSSYNGYSPYSTTSTFAGNKYFINIDKIKKFSFYDDEFLKSIDKHFEESNFCNFDTYRNILNPFLQHSFELFNKSITLEEQEKFNLFVKNNNFWLEDYALYEALSEHFKTNNWLEWEEKISKRDSDALKIWKDKLSIKIKYNQFIQWLFFTQWNELKKYCNEKNIKLIGDIPIYVCFESADAWSNPDIFQLDEKTGKPLEIAGVPPDYFSETGQRWGNPLYNWHDKKSELNKNTLNWWVKRIKHITSVVDILRIDHFRAIEAYWAIPESEKTAINGEWKKGPDKEFFKYIKNELGELPIIAEDLGVITPEVEELRDYFDFPGMKILQFAFDINNKNTYIRHNLANPNCIIYTGTHDNNTTNGWYYGSDTSQEQKEYIKKYLNLKDDHDMHYFFIKEAYSTTADLVIIPAQDIIGLGSEHRMNTPGTIENNWLWKLKKDELKENHINMFSDLVYFYNRKVEVETEVK